MALPRKILLLAAVALVAIIALVAVFFLRDMHRAYARLQSGSELVRSPLGDIEYVRRGTGTPVLVVHGSGGGYDQGELVAEAVLGDGFEWIVPSRFGYLRSTLTAGATWDEQAHVYAYLLDRLGVDRVAVVAMSHGGPSALMFAAMYPDRVASLTLVSCGVAPLTTAAQADANRKGALLRAIFAHDLSYWLVSRLLRKQLLELIGASAAVAAGLDTPRRSLVERFVDYMNPASLRAEGVVFDNETPLPGERIRAITAPTLVLHAKDDTLQLFANAEFAAAAIPDARLMAFERGGHVVAIVEQAAVRAAVRAHIERHRPRP